MVLPVLIELTPGTASSSLASEVAPPFSSASLPIVAVCCIWLVWRFIAVTSTLPIILASSAIFSVSVCEREGANERTSRLKPTEDTSILAFSVLAFSLSWQWPLTSVTTGAKAALHLTTAPAMGSPELSLTTTTF